MPSRTINLAEVIDRARLGGFQARIILLCALIAMLDGFDTQAVAFVAPILAAAMQVPVSSFGPVFGIGLLGLAVGALCCGPLADRWGRRTLIIASTAVFGLFSAATAYAQGVPDLMACRFLTGIGLGGAMPNIITLTSEYAPRRSRAMLVTVMFCGFPLGAVIGGLASTRIIGAFGWQGVFLMGGILPLALVPVLLAALPESSVFLAGRPGQAKRIAAILRRIDPGHANDDGADYALAEPAHRGLSVGPLFRDGRGRVTLLLWLAFFMNLLTLFFLINWLPSVLQRAGVPLERAIIATVLLNLGGIVGGILLGRLMDALGPYRVLTASYLGGALCVLGLGLAGASVATAFAMVFLAGFCIMGSQFGANALAVSLYPGSMRATGIGWALGIGRVGSIIGPVLGGVMFALGWSLPVLFSLSALPGLLSAAAVAGLGLLSRRGLVRSGPIALEELVH